MQRITILFFGTLSYVVFLGVFLYLIAFVGNLQATALIEWLPVPGTLVPLSIDAGRTGTGPVPAVAINLVLIALFGMQHSVMARMGFKDWIHRVLPPSAERSVFVLMASLVLALLMWQWRPIPVTVWEVESNWAVAIGWTIFAAGFGIVLLSTFLIDHFDLFGLKQVWLQMSGKRPSPPRFQTPMFYRMVRHPLYFGFLLAFWGTPHMTVGHMLFAGGMTVYILIAIRFEERDLVHFHGTKYEHYRNEVPMIVPVPGRRSAG